MMEAPSSAGVKGSSAPPDELELLEEELAADEPELDDELLDDVELLPEDELLDVEPDDVALPPSAGT